MYVFTDDEVISNYILKEYADNKKCKVMARSAESATDEASTETALKEFVKKIDGDYDILCLLQATSPLTTSSDIHNVLGMITHEKFDSALTVVQDKRFIWDKSGKPINYDYTKRPRRQEFDGLLIENGAVYATTKEQFDRSGIRIGGKIGIVTMPDDTLVEIDEPRDWVIMEKLMEHRLRQNKKLASKIKALFLDVDGVFTSGGVSYGESGELSKEFSVRDGMGLEILRDNTDVELFVMTAENSAIVASRMKKLNISNCYLNIKDKFAKVEEILMQRGLEKSEVAYIGDDVNDMANMLSVGWSFCPSDAMMEVRQSADIVLNNKGGREAIREAVNFIMNYNQRGV